MAIKENQIDYETPCGVAWVLNEKGVYYAMVHKGTHATTDSAYHCLCLAKARADYIAKRSKKKMKQKFTLSLVWCSEARDIRLETAPKSHFPDGIRLLSPVSNWAQYFIKEIEIEITLPEDFDPLKPQLDALETLEKSIKEKYQLDLAEIEGKRHQLLKTKV